MISVKDLTKEFHIYRSSRDRFMELITGKKRHSLHLALNQISFEVRNGETLGIVGRNGAGKSTLLKILLGVLLPDQGRIDMKGRITGLLELGTGFHPELSGFENILLNGMMLGMSRDEAEKKRDRIIEFSELGDFINEPIKTYSSGMTMRLGFSIALHADPDCFVVDEALSVGDAYFQQKSMDAIRDFKKKGGSILFVSHDMNAVRVLCDRAILLENGRLLLDGDPELVTNEYQKLITSLSSTKSKGETRKQDNHEYGNFSARIEYVAVEGQQSKTSSVISGESTLILLTLKAKETLSDITVGIMVRDRFGQDIFGTNTHHLKEPIKLIADRICEIVFRVDMTIAPGEYTITAALHTGTDHYSNCIHWMDRAASFTVAGQGEIPFSGISRLNASVSFHDS